MMVVYLGRIKIALVFAFWLEIRKERNKETVKLIPKY